MSNLLCAPTMKIVHQYCSDQIHFLCMYNTARSYTDTIKGTDNPLSESKGLLRVGSISCRSHE